MFYDDDGGAESLDANMEDLSANVMILILHQQDRNLTLSQHDAKNLLKKYVFYFICFANSVLFVCLWENRNNGNVNAALDELQNRSRKKIDDDDDDDAHGVDQQSKAEITDDKSQTKTVEVFYFCILFAWCVFFLCCFCAQRQRLVLLMVLLMVLWMWMKMI